MQALAYFQLSFVTQKDDTGSAVMFHLKNAVVAALTLATILVVHSRCVKRVTKALATARAAGNPRAAQRARILRRLGWGLVWLLTTVAFMPVIKVLLSPIKCNDNAAGELALAAAPAVPCYSSARYVLPSVPCQRAWFPSCVFMRCDMRRFLWMALNLPLFVAFVPVGVRLGRLDGNINHMHRGPTPQQIAHQRSMLASAGARTNRVTPAATPRRLVGLERPRTAATELPVVTTPKPRAGTPVFVGLTDQGTGNSEVPAANSPSARERARARATRALAHVQKRAGSWLDWTNDHARLRSTALVKTDTMVDGAVTTTKLVMAFALTWWEETDLGTALLSTLTSMIVIFLFLWRMPHARPAANYVITGLWCGLLCTAFCSIDASVSGVFPWNGYLIALPFFIVLGSIVAYVLDTPTGRGWIVKCCGRGEGTSPLERVTHWRPSWCGWPSRFACCGGREMTFTRPTTAGVAAMFGFGSGPVDATANDDVDAAGRDVGVDTGGATVTVGEGGEMVMAGDVDDDGDDI